MLSPPFSHCRASHYVLRSPVFLSLCLSACLFVCLFVSVSLSLCACVLSGCGGICVFGVSRLWCVPLCACRVLFCFVFSGGGRARRRPKYPSPSRPTTRTSSGEISVELRYAYNSIICFYYAFSLVLVGAWSIIYVCILRFSCLLIGAIPNQMPPCNMYFVCVCTVTCYVADWCIPQPVPPVVTWQTQRPEGAGGEAIRLSMKWLTSAIVSPIDTTGTGDD